MDLDCDFAPVSYEDACNDTLNGTVEYPGDGRGAEYLCPHTLDFGTINAALFFLIFVLSVVGNSLLLCALVRYEDLKKVTNLFILNLACSDLVFTVTLPFWAVYHLWHWVFGDFACKLLTGAYFVGVYSSVFLLTALTLDRFATIVIQWPNQLAKRRGIALGACVAAWAVSVAASLPDAIASKAEVHLHGYLMCEAPYVSQEGKEDAVGYYLQVALLFILPFAIIVFCYAAILRTVLQTTRKKHRTVVVVLCIVVAFAVCWGPLNVLIFIRSVHNPECDASNRFDLAFEICRLLAYSHCCVNPFLYMLSRTFRGHLLNLVRCGGAHGRRNGGNRASRQSLSNFSPDEAAKVQPAENCRSLDMLEIKELL